MTYKCVLCGKIEGYPKLHVCQECMKDADCCKGERDKL